MNARELVTPHLKKSGGVNASSLSDKPAKNAILASSHADCTHHGNGIASLLDLLTEQMCDAATFFFSHILYFILNICGDILVQETEIMEDS